MANENLTKKIELSEFDRFADTREARVRGCTPTQLQVGDLAKFKYEGREYTVLVALTKRGKSQGSLSYFKARTISRINNQRNRVLTAFVITDSLFSKVFTDMWNKLFEGPSFKLNANSELAYLSTKHEEGFVNKWNRTRTQSVEFTTDDSIKTTIAEDMQRGDSFKTFIFSKMRGTKRIR